jgi:hypothetical protein
MSMLYLWPVLSVFRIEKVQVNGKNNMEEKR